MYYIKDLSYVNDKVNKYRCSLNFKLGVITLPKTLIINNTPYAYPTPGDEPGWGGDATGWAEGVTEVLGDLLGPNDILETAFNVANNQTTDADVIGLVFNAASVRSAKISYSVYRVSNANPSGLAESGELDIVYDNAALSWLIAQGNTVGNSGITFTITPTGQVQYKSTDIGSLQYSGTMKFRAKTLQQ